MGKYFFYNNGPSANHGCEAIALSTHKILGLESGDNTYSSYNIESDSKYKLDNYYNLYDSGKKLNFSKFKKIVFYAYRKIFKNNNLQNKYQFSDTIKAIQNEKICIALGGDNFCYKNATGINLYLNQRIKEKNVKNVLWGCSVDEAAINDELGRKALEMFDMIVARESLTYNLLTKNGINKNVKLIPDPAFQLDIEDVVLPEDFEKSPIVGINASDLICNYEAEKGLTLRNYERLIEYILDSTDKKILLIAHVESDTVVLDKFVEKFNSDRIYCVKNTGCKKLKGYISKCEAFIGARTHSTIAAYSTCVPTLVVGYSIKSKGIARDIFGTEENYVIGVDSFKDEDSLLKSYLWLDKNKSGIREYLESFMPAYSTRAMLAKDAVLELLKTED